MPFACVPWRLGLFDERTVSWYQVATDDGFYAIGHSNASSEEKVKYCRRCTLNSQIEFKILSS